MGIDLSLMVVQYQSQIPWLLHNRVSLDRDYELQDAIRRIEQQFIPATGEVLSYEDEGIKRRTDDPYGDLLKFVQAGQLTKHTNKVSTTMWNSAALAWIASLPKATPVVLWWH